jgi:hypothetical protein
MKKVPWESRGQIARRFGDLERECRTAKAFYGRLPPLHPDNKSELIGDTNVDLTGAERPCRDW